MSDIPVDWHEQIDLRAELARIDRDRAETQKLLAEMTKLNAEGHKFNRERWVVPVTVAGALLAAAVARIDVILHAFGVPT